MGVEEMAYPKEVLVKFESAELSKDRQDFAKHLQDALHVGVYLEGPLSDQSSCKLFVRLLPGRKREEKLIDVLSLETKKWMNSRGKPEVVELFNDRGQLITSISRK